jgi:hypothetical protein
MAFCTKLEAVGARWAAAITTGLSSATIVTCKVRFCPSWTVDLVALGIWHDAQVSYEGSSEKMYDD